MVEYIIENGRRYAKKDGELIFVGERSLEERNTYVNKKAAQYKAAHPETTDHYAKRQARLRWRNNVLRPKKVEAK